jgi:hypothetical protein
MRLLAATGCSLLVLGSKSLQSFNAPVVASFIPRVIGRTSIASPYFARHFSKFATRQARVVPAPTFQRLFMSTNSEEAKAAQDAASTDAAVNPNAPTFFDKIVSKEVKANIIYEDDLWWVEVVS